MRGPLCSFSFLTSPFKVPPRLLVEAHVAGQSSSGNKAGPACNEKPCLRSPEDADGWLPADEGTASQEENVDDVLELCEKSSPGAEGHGAHVSADADGENGSGPEPRDSCDSATFLLYSSRMSDLEIVFQLPSDLTLTVSPMSKAVLRNNRR